MPAISVSLGAFFEILTVIANIATAMVLFPLLRRQNETLALSYVAARFIEAALIVVGMLSLLAVETLRQDGAGADPDSLLVASQSLVAVHDWTFLLGPGFMSGLGNGLLLGYLMYRSGLLSRRLTIFGIIGGPLVMASGIAVLFGVIEAGSTAQGVATILEIVWEIGILGLLLIFKGFQPAAAASLLSRIRGRGHVDRRPLRHRPSLRRSQVRHDRRRRADSNAPSTSDCPGRLGAASRALSGAPGGGSASAHRRPATSSGCCASRRSGGARASHGSRSSATTRTARTSSRWP